MTVKQSIGPAQAYTFIARLFADDLSEHEALAIREWRMADPANEREFIKTLLLFGSLETRTDEIAAIEQPDSSFSTNENKSASTATQTKSAKPHRLRKLSWQKYAIAATLLLGITLAYEAWHNSFGIFWSDSADSTKLDRFITRVSEQKSLLLEDGSKVMLNTGSEILVGITDKNRWVRLERGEAFFNIKNDPERPFTVHVNNKAVRVLGTQFNIIKSPGKFTLSVVEGLVAVHREEEELQNNAPVLVVSPDDIAKSKETLIENAGQRQVMAGTVVEFNTESNSVLVHKGMDPIKTYGWTSGRLHFEAVTFAEMIKELNRYMGKKILIEDQSIMNLKIYAVVDIKRIYQALDSFEKTLSVKFTHHHDRIVATANR